MIKQGEFWQGKARHVRLGSLELVRATDFRQRIRCGAFGACFGRQHLRLLLLFCLQHPQPHIPCQTFLMSDISHVRGLCKGPAQWRAPSCYLTMTLSSACFPLLGRALLRGFRHALSPNNQPQEAVSAAPPSPPPGAGTPCFLGERWVKLPEDAVLCQVHIQPRIPFWNRKRTIARM